MCMILKRVCTRASELNLGALCNLICSATLDAIKPHNDLTVNCLLRPCVCSTICYIYTSNTLYIHTNMYLYIHK